MLDKLLVYNESNLPSSLLLVNNGKKDITHIVCSFIKSIHCQLNKSPECVCQSCVLNDLDHPDMRFLSADTLSIDDVRKIIHFAHLAPTLSNFKTIVIYEVESLSKAAKNALLKTLEEPNLNQHFILTTNCEHNVLPTVQSRCVKIRIPYQNTPVINPDVVEVFESILDGQSNDIAKLRSHLKQIGLVDFLDNLYLLSYTLIRMNLGVIDRTLNTSLKITEISERISEKHLFSIINLVISMRKSIKSTKLNEELCVDRLIIKIMRM